MTVNGDWVLKQMDRFKILGYDPCKRVNHHAAKWHPAGSVCVRKGVASRHWWLSCPITGLGYVRDGWGQPSLPDQWAKTATAAVDKA